MSSSEHSQTAVPQKSAVDMSSEAISRRIRLVSELNQLGLSLAKAKPCPAPDAPAGRVSQPANPESKPE